MPQLHMTPTSMGGHLGLVSLRLAQSCLATYVSRTDQLLNLKSH